MHWTAGWCIHIPCQLEPFTAAKAIGQVVISIHLSPSQLMHADSLIADSPLAHRNTIKIKDWIDAVYVKKRFYSAEAASSAMHLPPAPQPQVGGQP